MYTTCSLNDGKYNDKIYIDLYFANLNIYNRKFKIL